MSLLDKYRHMQIGTVNRYAALIDEMKGWGYTLTGDQIVRACLNYGPRCVREVAQEVSKDKSWRSKNAGFWYKLRENKPTFKKTPPSADN